MVAFSTGFMQLRLSGRLSETHATPLSNSTLTTSLYRCMKNLYLCGVKPRKQIGKWPVRVSIVIQRRSVNSSMPARPPKRP
jgi:hypothetical protein